MTSVRLTPQARTDLDDIWAYTAKQWSFDQAEAYMRMLDASFQLLARHPSMGRGIDDIREGYFKFPAASHLLIFRIQKGHVEIVRILHKSSDVETQLQESN
jgi:toxin ParE1/3/4